MKNFLQTCGIDTIKNRLKTCSEAQREELTKILKAKHQELKDL